MLPAFAQGTAFTYQGQLGAAGGPAGGTFDFTFALFDSASGGTQQGTTVTNAGVAISNGLFSVTLDFGNQFPGADRWLEIGVCTNGLGAFATLSPRQKLGPAPYSISAGNLAGTVSATQLTGTISPNNIAAGSITGTKLANGSVSSAQLAAGSVSSSSLADGAVTFKKLQTVFVGASVGSLLNPNVNSANQFASTLFSYSPQVFVADPGYSPIIGGFNNYGQSGALYLFNTNGTLALMVTNPVAEAGDHFGQAIGNFQGALLVGAPGFNNQVGRVCMIGLPNQLVNSFSDPGATIGDQFGSTLGVTAAQMLLIGAPGSPVGATRSGVVYVYGPISPGVVATITNPAPLSGALFGSAIATLGPFQAVIGAPHGGTGSGAAYLYTNITPFSVPILQTIFTNPSASSLAAFGSSIATLGSDRVLIGAPFDNTGATEAGAAYLFNTNGALVTTFTNPAPVVNGQFGMVVATLAPDKILVTAQNNNASTATQAGVAYLFSTNGILLGTFESPNPATGGLFGSSLLVVATNQVLVGATGEHTAAPGVGAAYLYNLGGDAYLAGLSVNHVIANTITTTSIANGAVTAAKIGGVLNASQIPSLDASTITTGALADARLSSNVALRSGGNNFTGNQSVTSGNLGVGTASPTAQLDIAANGQAEHVHAISSGSASFLEFDDFANSFRGLIGVDGTGFSGASTQFSIASWTSHPIGLFTAGIERMAITPAGNVGIGTTSPQQLLQVGDNNVVGSQGLIRLASRGSSGASRSWDIGCPMSQTSSAGKFYSFAVQDTSAAIPAFLIRWDSQFVGINNTNPAAQLDVNGNIAMGNGQWFQARNTNNVLENFLWPRWDDNMTYLNYGAAGFNIRNNSSATTMFMQNNGYVGIGSSAPANQLQVNSPYLSAAGYGLMVAGANYGANIQINASAAAGGAALILDDYSDGGANVDMLLIRNNNAAQTAFSVLANGSTTVGGGLSVGSGISAGGTITANQIGINGLYGNDTLTINQRAGDNAAIYANGKLALNAQFSGCTMTVSAASGDNNALYVNGNLYVNGTPTDTASIFWTQASDARLKQDIRRFEPGLGELLQLRTVRFRYQDNPQRRLSCKDDHAGVLAQEVQKVFPDAVTTDQDGYLSLKADPIFWASINAIQELNQKVEQKDKEVADLKQQLADLKQLVNSLSEKVNGATK